MNASIMQLKPLRAYTWLPWGLFALLLATAPLQFGSGTGLSVLSQMGTTIIFALSYNMLLGQAGMLSFGHAIYSGLAAFCVVHVMNSAVCHSWHIPVAAMPLLGGVAASGFALIFGYVATRRSGIASSMITLGLVELVFASSLIFPGFFGGEGGISTNRVMENSYAGWTLGPEIEVYYLIACWLFVATIAMYAFTKTPLGRLANAVRDNAERAEFIGYDPRLVRYLVVIVSAFFAGIAGSLTAINFEIVGAENVSVNQSGLVLLFTVIGGIGYFWGPILGAIVGVLFTVLLSIYTKAWHLYLGLTFLWIVLFVPGGLAAIFTNIIFAQRKIDRVDVGGMRLTRLTRNCSLKKTSKLMVIGACATAGWVGAIMSIEMLYRQTLDTSAGSIIHIASVAIDSTDHRNWIVAAMFIFFSVAGFIISNLRFRIKIPKFSSTVSFLK